MLALNMIVRDNQKEMEYLLPKISSFFDEVVIIDTGSKDKTVKVCKKYKANVFHFKWINDFSAARNFALSKTKSEWVFWIDSDDDVPEGLENLKELISGAEEKGVDGFTFIYNYARDEFGNIVAVQWRERLLRKEKFEWKGQLHETAIQKSRALVVKSDDVVVNHLATIEQMSKSNKRNIDILKAEVKRDGDKVDPRTLYYIAQTYRGLKDWENAALYYTKYLEVGAWDEERMQAWHFLADALRFKGDYNAAIISDHEAIKIKPDWPDGYFGLGDTYFYMGDASGKDEYFEKAIEWIKMGFSKKVPETIRVIEPVRYTWMPLLQMSICQLNLGKVREAYKNYTKALELSNNADFAKQHLPVFQDGMEMDMAADNISEYMKFLYKNDRAKLKDIDKVISQKIGGDPRVAGIRTEVLPPKTWDKNSVVIFCAASYEEWAPPSTIKGIGGSEEATIYLSKELTKLGYDVTVYNQAGSLRGDYEGVKYRNIWELNPKDNFNVFISWRNPFSFKTIKANHKWVWLHDVPEGAEDIYTEELLKNIDKIVVLSEFHRGLLPMVPDEKIFISNNGIVPEQFNKIKKTRSLFWGSSYDRGLECMLEKIYPLVLKEVPDVTLDICYGWNTFDEMNKDNPTAMAWKDKIEKLMKQKGIKHHGRVSHQKVAKLMGQAKVWAYPTEFWEINCITLQKAQVANCIPVTTNVAALRERNLYGVMIDTDKIYSDEKKQKEFAKAVINQLKNPNKIPIDEAKKLFSWETTAKDWAKQWTSNS